MAFIKPFFCFVFLKRKMECDKSMLCRWRRYGTGLVSSFHFLLGVCLAGIQLFYTYSFSQFGWSDCFMAIERTWAPELSVSTFTRVECLHIHQSWVSPLHQSLVSPHWKLWPGFAKDSNTACVKLTHHAGQGSVWCNLIVWRFLFLLLFVVFHTGLQFSLLFSKSEKLTTKWM